MAILNLCASEHCQGDMKAIKKLPQEERQEEGPGLHMELPLICFHVVDICVLEETF